MRNISIRMPEELLEWLDEQIKKVGRFGSRADVFREALIQFMNPITSVELRRIMDIRKQGDALIETAEHHSPFFICSGDNLSIDLGSQHLVLDAVEPRKILLKIYTGRGRKIYLDFEKKKRQALGILKTLDE